MNNTVFTHMKLSEFLHWYSENKPKRFVTEVHLHHLWKPDKHSYITSSDKDKVIQAVYKNDKDVKGLNGFGHHLLITPDGEIWLGRALDEAPSSIKGRNGNDKFGPFSIAILGNFDKDKERLEDEQLNSTLGVLRLLFDTHHINDEKFIFHSEHSPRTSPGSSLNKLELLQLVHDTESYVREFIPYRDCESRIDKVAIASVVDSGYMDLASDGSFYPNSIVTRAELANVIAKLSYDAVR